MSNRGAKRSKEPAHSCIQAWEKRKLRQIWARPGAPVAGDAPHKVGFVLGSESKRSIPEYTHPPAVNAYAIFGTEIPQGPWNRQLTPSTETQHLTNTLFLISCTPPVITELAGKPERLQMWPLSCAFRADAEENPREENTLNSLLF